MSSRRPLGAGVKPSEDIDQGIEKQFVYGAKTDAKEPNKSTPATPEVREANGAKPVGRMPLTTRVRADYGTALKRASLERQLSGQLPNTVQDILEDALGPWLRSNGYIE
jgi:hypothetical protein